MFLENAQIAQSVEQGTENPRVGGSIPPLGTMIKLGYLAKFFFYLNGLLVMYN